MSIVVLAEKPSVARDIARVLGASRRGEGCLIGDRYIVTWAIGHLVHFAEPNEYPATNWDARWSFNQLPMIPSNWLLKTSQQTADQFHIVKRLINSPDTTELICATDAGREGENIFRLIYEHAGCTKPFSRLWVSSLTDEALQDGLAKLHPGTAFDDLARAARARAQADWLVGMNMTRAYTVHHRSLYTIGRVQTPTLGMIVARELLITQFQKAFYYEIVADFNEGFRAKYLHSEEKGKETRIEPKALTERLHARFKSQSQGTVHSVTVKIRKNNPPQLYDLITLQKDANRRFNLTASETLANAQKLYEQYKLITYPRTESRHISEDMVAQLPRILQNLNHPQAGAALARLKAGHKLSKLYVDKTKLSDHHGIIPTTTRAPESLPRELRLLYELVVTRFVAIFLPEQVVEETIVLVDIDGAMFRARGTVELEPGWKLAEPSRKEDKDPEEGALPVLTKGQVVNIADMQLLEKETAPPKRYTDATLLTAMKNAGKEVEDDQLAQAMKEQGLGTPATRAEIIEKLIRTRLIVRQKKVIFPTEKGMALISVCHDLLKSPEMTGKWEQKLKDVENGEYSVDRFNHAIESFVRKLVPQITQTRVLAYREPDLKLPPRPANSAEEREDEAGEGGEEPKKKGKGPAKPKKAAKTAEAEPGVGFGPCPRCGQGRIIEGRAAYGCNRFREGCRLTFPKQFEGKALSAKQVGDLIAKGKTTVVKSFGGRVLFQDGVLSLEKADPTAKKSKVNTSLPPLNGLSCPKCGKGRIIEGKRGYGCNRFREGCDFVTWKEQEGRTKSEAELYREISGATTRK